MNEDIVAKAMIERRKAQQDVGKIPACDLPVGKFADLNGSIIYRFESVTTKGGWGYLNGCWMIEQHNHKTPYDEMIQVGEGDWEYFVKPIDNPSKKHIDNTIAILRKTSKDGLLSGLCFLEHLTALKELLRAYRR